MSTPDTAPPLSARDRILAVAGPLFYRHGTRAIGIDRVIAESGVAKATFYRHFPSKDDLIVAWVAASAEREAGAPPDVTAPRALSDWIDRLIESVRHPNCLGCPMQGTAAEFGEPDHPAHRAARAAKEATLAELAQRARMEGLRDPDGTAAEAFLLAEGLLASRRIFGRDAPIEAAGRALRRLVASART